MFDQKKYIVFINRLSLNCYIQANYLTQSKQQFPYLKKVLTQVLQSAWKRLDKAWDDFFHIQRKFPKFKHQNRLSSFIYPQVKQS